jgi:hypothetical protein
VSYITPGGVHWLANGGVAPVTEADIQAAMGGGAPQSSAPSGLDHLLPPSAPQGGPSDFREPGIGGALDTTIRTLARGVPLLGQAADYGDAAINATLAPFVEPVLDMIPGHDRKWDIGGGKTWQDRYDRAMAMQRGMDSQVDHDAPIASAAGQILGGGAGILASGGLLTPATGALARLAPAAGVIPQMATGAVDGALLGAGSGYLQGDGGFTDPSRFRDASQDAAVGGIVGGAAPAVFSGAKTLWDNSVQKALDALTSRVRVGAPDSSATPPVNTLAAALHPGPAFGPVDPAADSLATAIETHGLPPGGSSPNAAVDAAAVRTTAPSVSVPRSAANEAYDRIYRAVTRAGQTPAEALAQAQRLGTFGTLADTSVPVQDFARTVADAPGQAGKIARGALDLRQQGEMESGQYSVLPASLRIADTLGASLGVSGRTAAGDTEGLLAAQKASAGPAYAKAYSAPPVALSDLQEFAQSPMFRSAYDRARSISQKEFVKLPDGTEAIQPIPPFEALGASSRPSASAPPLIDPAADAEGLARARSDVDLYGPRQGGDLFSAIRARGGVRVKDASGQRYLVGPDMDALAVQSPGVLNNRNGMAPEDMAQSLADEGWFGASVEDPSKAFEAAWNEQAAGRPVYHPDAQDIDFNYRKADFDREASDAGVSANDSPAEAAAKLHAYRTADDAERAAVQWEGNLGDPDEAEFDRLASPGGRTLDWRTLDLTKQAMDDMIREGKVQGIGANDQAATKGFLTRYVAKLDSLNPDYAPARAAFAGPAKLLDAIDAGRAYMGEDAPAIASAMGKMSPSEQEAFRVGALQAERDRLGGVPVTHNAAMRAGVNTPNRLAKLQQLFPDQATYGRYVDMLQNENTMFGTRARVLNGSLTSRNLGHQEDADHNPLEALSEVAELHHNPAGGAMRLLGRLITAGNGQRMREPVSDAAASILFNSHPDAFPDFSAGLAEAAKRAAMAHALSGTARPAATASAVGLADALQRGNR